eukprot:1158894-Pelagomonas_calceolata.AAC.6
MGEQEGGEGIVAYVCFVLVVPLSPFHSPLSLQLTSNYVHAFSKLLRTEMPLPACVAHMAASIPRRPN